MTTTQKTPGTAQAATTYQISGNTYPVRTTLRNAGWTWSRGQQAWMIDHDEIEGGGFAAAKALRANWPGCILRIAHHGGMWSTVWTSKTYTAAPVVTAPASFGGAECPECGSRRPNSDCCVCGGHHH